ncbi:cytochrome c oxidase, cbb3-type, subunit i [Chryseobacterium sp. StRB126]|nr:cytochrome c oxidase, cbb3-type, subunit i [Chryseobacterium sp. StRB126]
MYLIQRLKSILQISGQTTNRLKIVKDIFSEANDLKEAYAKKPQGELEKKEIVALISYLQRLGTDIKTTEIKTASNN